MYHLYEITWGQVNTLSDPLSSLRDLINEWLGLSVEKNIINLKVIILICVVFWLGCSFCFVIFLPVPLSYLWHLPPMPDIAKWVTPLLAYSSGHTPDKGAFKMARAGHQRCWKRSSRRCDHRLTCELDWGCQRYPNPSPVLQKYVLPTISQVGVVFKNTRLWESNALLRTSEPSKASWVFLGRQAQRSIHRGPPTTSLKYKFPCLLILLVTNLKSSLLSSVSTCPLCTGSYFQIAPRGAPKLPTWTSNSIFYNGFVCSNYKEFNNMKINNTSQPSIKRLNMWKVTFTTVHTVMATKNMERCSMYPRKKYNYKDWQYRVSVWIWRHWNSHTCMVII